SIVLRLDYGESSILLMGDLPTRQETQLIQTQTKLRAQVLKVGHHGSSYSSSLPFLQAVKPAWSIVSCGLHNLFHHPAPAALARLQAVGSLVLITKDTSQVILQTSGQGRWQRIQGAH
ncbi:MAG: MBL fold metallo-hydrolase, partial [Candidatus Komeilibacteria bacterium]|nr:MBL fold metallo-hydrolase [Candidatus Komeilibacteria bacterium]